MKIVPIDVAHKTFKKKMMGVDSDDVTEFLHSVADEMEALIKDRNDLKEQLREKELRIMEYKDRDKILKDTIETAQRMSEKIRTESEREAKLIINDAHHKSEIITRDARDSLRKVYGEITDIKKSRIQMEANLRALLNAHMQLLDEQTSLFPEVKLTPQTATTTPVQAANTKSSASISPVSS